MKHSSSVARRIPRVLILSPHEGSHINVILCHSLSRTHVWRAFHMDVPSSHTHRFPLTAELRGSSGRDTNRISSRSCDCSGIFLWMPRATREGMCFLYVSPQASVKVPVLPVRRRNVSKSFPLSDARPSAGFCLSGPSRDGYISIKSSDIARKATCITKCQKQRTGRQSRKLEKSPGPGPGSG